MSHLSTAELSAALDGALTGPDSQQILAHLTGCVLCQEQQARYALHDRALRRLFSPEPEARALEDLARGVIERLARFTPPEDFGPPTIPQEATATPADPAHPLPPAREPSRGMHRPGAEGDAEATPFELAPRFDTERTPSGNADRTPEALVESYDAFNDIAYAGPATRESPPMLGRPPLKKEGDADTAAPKREYRHGGVRHETPTSTARPREDSRRRDDRAKATPRKEGFGVKRAQEPAWARLGLQPDPSAPGVYRDTLTGAAVTPPPVHSRRPGAARSSSRRGVVIASLALVGGLAAVVLAMRIPTGAHLDVKFGRPATSAPVATPATIEVKSATTPPPVDVAVPQAATAPATTLDELRLCGQVVDAKGRPVAGALLTVASTVAQTRTGPDGRFCLGAPVGTQLVEVLDPRGSGTTAHRIHLEFVSGAPEARIALP